MRKIALLCLCGLLAAQSQTNLRPIEIQVTPRLFQDNKLQVSVQVDNHSGRSISLMDGFLYETNRQGVVIKETRIQIITATEPALQNGAAKTESVVLPYKEHQSSSFTYQTGKIRFSGEYRVYTYHPAVGLIRID